MCTSERLTSNIPSWLCIMVLMSLLLWGGSLSVWLITLSADHSFNSVMCSLGVENVQRTFLLALLVRRFWSLSHIRPIFVSLTASFSRLFSPFPSFCSLSIPIFVFALCFPSSSPSSCSLVHHKKQVLYVSTQWPNEGVWVHTEGQKGKIKKKRQTEKGRNRAESLALRGIEFGQTGSLGNQRRERRVISVCNAIKSLFSLCFGRNVCIHVWHQ